MKLPAGRETKQGRVNTWRERGGRNHSRRSMKDGIVRVRVGMREQFRLVFDQLLKKANVRTNNRSTMSKELECFVDGGIVGLHQIGKKNGRRA